jgi:hypothetical protein
MVKGRSGVKGKPITLNESVLDAGVLFCKTGLVAWGEVQPATGVLVVGEGSKPVFLAMALPVAGADDQEAS